MLNSQLIRSCLSGTKEEAGKWWKNLQPRERNDSEMKGFRNRILLIILAIFCMPFSAGIVSAQETEITGNFITLEHPASWDYVYKDEFFLQPPDQYNHEFARLSLGMALSAFRNTLEPEAQDKDLLNYLSGMGFTEAETGTYRNEPTPDSISFGIANKQIGDITVIACAVCGGNYSKEWASNLTVDDGIRSAGFQDAALKVEAALSDYLNRHMFQGKIRLWISGFSRAAAVSNLTAADCTTSGVYDAVYAYTFATPRTTREPEPYTNIFNIIKKEDVVPKVPLADWGYGRYGIDLFLVSPETDIDSSKVTERAAELYREMLGAEMVDNSEINHQLRIIMDYLLMLFPDPASYMEYLQPLLVDIMSDSEDTKGALQVLLEALQSYGAEEGQQREELKALLDYLTTLINAYYLRGDMESQPADQWDPQFGTANLFNEHFPFEYLSMMYASDDPSVLFSDNMEYIRLVVYGNVDITISDDSSVLKTVLADGTEISDEDHAPVSFPDVNHTREKNIITFPANRSLELLVQSKSFLPQTITYTGLLLSNRTVRAKADDVYSFIMKRGDTANITTSINGRAVEPKTSDYTNISGIVETIYSPTTAMRLENNKIVTLTISGFVNKLLFILVFLLAQLIASAILGIIRKKKNKERNICVTCLWHAVVAGVLAILELAMWFFLPVFPVVKLICGLLVSIVIFVFALKGYKLHKERKKIFEAHVVSLVIFFVLQNLLLGDFSIIKGMILLFGYLIFFNASFFLLWLGKARGHDSLESVRVSGGA